MSYANYVLTPAYKVVNISSLPSKADGSNVLSLMLIGE